MAEEPNGELIADQIKSGELDGNLVMLLEAIRVRFTNGPTAQRWKISHREAEFKQGDLTMKEARLVERITGTSWANLNPTTSATECMAIIAACLHVRDGKALTFTREGAAGEAWDEASSLNMEETIAAISSYEVESAPKP